MAKIIPLIDARSLNAPLATASSASAAALTGFLADTRARSLHDLRISVTDLTLTTNGPLLAKKAQERADQIINATRLQIHAVTSLAQADGNVGTLLRDRVSRTPDISKRGSPIRSPCMHA